MMLFLWDLKLIEFNIYLCLQNIVEKKLVEIKYILPTEIRNKVPINF